MLSEYLPARARQALEPVGRIRLAGRGRFPGTGRRPLEGGDPPAVAQTTFAEDDPALKGIYEGLAQARELMDATRDLLQGV